MDARVAEIAPRLAAAAERELELLVDVSSPSGDVPGAEAAISLAVSFMPPGVELERLPCSTPGCADDLFARLHGTGSGRVLLLGHLDTVVSHAAHRPLERDGDRLTGSGTVDMKGGDAIALGLLRELAKLPQLFEQLALLLVVDEEWRTAPFTHAERFAGFDACLCFEAGERTPAGDDAVIVKRKAAGTLNVEAHGRASHSGSAPHKGRSALLALTHVAQLVAEQADPDGPRPPDRGADRAALRRGLQRRAGPRAADLRPARRPPRRLCRGARHGSGRARRRAPRRAARARLAGHGRARAHARAAAGCRGAARPAARRLRARRRERRQPLRQPHPADDRRPRPSWGRRPPSRRVGQRGLAAAPAPRWRWRCCSRCWRVRRAATRGSLRGACPRPRTHFAARPCSTATARRALGSCPSPAGRCRSSTRASAPSTSRCAPRRRRLRRLAHGRDRDERPAGAGVPAAHPLQRRDEDRRARRPVLGALPRGRRRARRPLHLPPRRGPLPDGHQRLQPRQGPGLVSRAGGRLRRGGRGRARRLGDACRPRPRGARGAGAADRGRRAAGPLPHRRADAGRRAGAGLRHRLYRRGRLRAAAGASSTPARSGTRCSPRA